MRGGAVGGPLRSVFGESGCLGLQPKVGGKLHLKLNTGERPIANKYREGKMKSTLKRELKSTVKPLGGETHAVGAGPRRFRGPRGADGGRTDRIAGSSVREALRPPHSSWAGQRRLAPGHKARVGQVSATPSFGGELIAPS